MKLGDMAALLVSGYSMDDLNTIKSLEKTEPDIVNVAKQVKSMSDLTALLAIAGDDEQPEQVAEDQRADNQPTAESVQVPDYKSLYEAEQKKTDDLNQKLKQAQKENVNRDVSGNEESFEDTIIDLYRAL